MGLRSRIRAGLVARGYRVPEALMRPSNRVFHTALNSIRPGMVVMDVGANRGNIAAAFAARGATVHAYEPNPDIYPELLAQAARDPRIIPEMCGILDCNDVLRLYLHREGADRLSDPSEASSFVAEKPNVSSEHFHTVPVRDVAEVVVGIGRPIDVMKLDPEGSEYRIVTRLLDTGLHERIGRIFVETHHDRIPSLRPEFERLVARVDALGLGSKINFDWE